jgi:hypothetical protein
MSSDRRRTGGCIVTSKCVNVTVRGGAVGRQSLLVTIVVLAATGAVPVAMRLLSAKSGLPVRRRDDHANAGVPGRSPATKDDRSRERMRNALADRGRGYIL